MSEEPPSHSRRDSTTSKRHQDFQDHLVLKDRRVMSEDGVREGARFSCLLVQNPLSSTIVSEDLLAQKDLVEFLEEGGTQGFLVWFWGTLLWRNRFD